MHSEQLCQDFGAALDFIEHYKPSVVMQRKHVPEFYDDETLLDRLILSDCRARATWKNIADDSRKMEGSVGSGLSAACCPDLRRHGS
jgi:hypothetical protein